MAIKIGTDCSGMEAPIQAIRNLNVSYEHKFSCDINVHARSTIEANFPHGHMYEDLTKRDNKKAPGVDIYVAGFPCQPFSAAGLGGAFDDKHGRGMIFFDVLDYLKKQKPRVFILENVSGLATREGGKYEERILDELEKLGLYNIDRKILDTKQQGIPHSRRRWYCVGILKSFDKGSFTFPEPIPCPSIELLLEKRDPELAASGLPPRTQTTALGNVKAELRRLKKSGVDPLEETYIIDCDSSPYRVNTAKGVMPCMTVSRGGGHWITSRGRRATKEEMMRLQGMNPTTFKVAVSETQLGKQIGNTMSVNVFERLLTRVLPAAGLVPHNVLTDRWESGQALKELSKTCGKGFMACDAIREVATAREGSPSPARVGKRRAPPAMSPPRPSKRRAMSSNAGKSPRK